MTEEIAYLALSTNFTVDELLKRKQNKSFKDLFYELENDFKIKKDWEKEYDNLVKQGIKIIFQDKLPERLKIAKVLGLYILGNIEPAFLYLAIVGTRRASQEGLKTAENFASELVNYEIVIVSGAAFGIDTAAHLGAIKSGGKTIAILGEGIDKFFNTRKNLAEKILTNQGTIISEYAPGTPGLPQNFPNRNRLIAALSDGIILIEVPEKSGALITAKYALEYNKDIFVVPHSIYNRNYYGGLRLIQEGANLIISTDDILHFYDIQKKDLRTQRNLSDKEKLVYELIQAGPKNLNDLLQVTAIPINELLSILTILEIKKFIFNRNGYFYAQ